MSKNTPEIRINGFDDSWKQYKLGDLSSSFQYGLNAAAKEFDGKNKYIRITDIDDNSRKFIQEDTTSPDIDLSNADSYKLVEGDLLFARTGASVGKTYIYDESDGLVYYAGFLIRAKIKGNYNPHFVFQNTLTNNYEKYIKITSMRSGQPGVNAQEYSQYELMVPSKTEQDKISFLFKNVDNFIAFHQQEYDKLVNNKKAMLEKMFPKEGCDVPEIRFNGFDKPWKKCKFGEIVKKYENPVPTPKDGYARLGIRSHAKGTFHSYVKKGMELETAQMHKVEAGNFIVNITFGWEHAVAITNEKDAGKLVSHRFPQYSFNEGFLPEYFKYVILDEKFRYHLWLSSPGGAGRNRVLNLNEMLEYVIVFPEKEEQRKIANVLQEIDLLIDLHKQELEKLKNIKTALLEKMFV